MKLVRVILATILIYSCSLSVVFCEDEEFDTEKMMAELEAQLELSTEQLSRLKPAIDAKSKELKESMKQAIDKGFLSLDAFTADLDAVSKNAQEKVGEFLNSEEVKKLKDYLSQVDKEAVREVRDKLVAELTAVLELTEEQVVKLKPILDDSLTQLSEMLGKLAQEGSQNWEEFKRQYEQFAQELREKLQSTLNNEQMIRLDNYQAEKKEKIKATLFTV